MPEQGGSDGFHAQDSVLEVNYLVVLSAPDQLGLSIVLASLPAVGTSYSGSYATTILVAGRRRARMIDDSGVNWIGTVEYVNYAAVSSLGGGASYAQPWNRKDTVSGGVVEHPTVLTRDFSSVDANGNPTGTAIQNKAGDAFDSPLMTNRKNWLLQIHRARQVVSYDPITASLCIGSLNEDSFSILGKTVAAEGALLHNIQFAEELWTDGTKYYSLVITIEIQRQYPLKYVRVQNKGWMSLDGDPNINGGKVHCVNYAPDPYNTAKVWIKNGKYVMVPVSAPVFLTDAGKRVMPSDPHAADPDYYDLLFQQYPVLDWAAVWT
jgi:hypothetical protein